MKTRNPNATCGNCPYWDISEDDETIGRCRHECASVGQEKDGKLYRAWMFYSYDLDWCGNHPDFWQTDAPATDREQQLRAALEGLREAAAASAYNLKIALDAAKEITS